MTLTVTLRVCRCAPQVLISNGPWVRVHVTHKICTWAHERLSECPTSHWGPGVLRLPYSVALDLLEAGSHRGSANCDPAVEPPSGGASLRALASRALGGAGLHRV